MSEAKVSLRYWMWGLTAVGLGLSAALEHTHYRAYAAPLATSYCSIGEKLDCASVALSKYSVVFGVPLPLWGLAGFLAIGLALWQRSRWLLPLTLLATLASVALVLVSAFDVGSFCLLCEGVHVVSVALAWLAWRTRADNTQSLRDLESASIVFGPPLGGLIAAALFVAPYWGAFGWAGDVPFAQGKTEEGHPWIGAREPKLIVEEFVEYTCPHCKAASARHLRQLAKHASELRIVRRHYPATPCEPRYPTSCLALRIALCAEEQGAFWRADRWLFEHGSLRAALDPRRAAADLSLDEAALVGCVDRDDISARGQAFWKQAKKLRIPGTPHYLVDGKVVAAPNVDALIEAL